MGANRLADGTAPRQHRKPMKRLPPETLRQAQALTRLIDLRRLEVEALQLGLEQLVEKATGVDLVKGQWQLDIDTGLLTRSVNNDQRTN